MAFNITAPISPFRAVGRNGSGASIQLIGSIGAGTDVLNRALAKVPAKDTSGDADFRFGKASRFTSVTPDKQTNPGATVTWPSDNNPDEEPKEIHVSWHDEVWRCWQTVRVENPDDPEQYVMDDIIFKLVFQSRDDPSHFIGLLLRKSDELGK